MSAATLPSNPSPQTTLPRMDGRAEIGFAEGRLRHLYQRAPLRVLFPTPAAQDPPLAALVTTSGGLTGGDRLALEVSVSADSRASVMASAAEKIYRSTGDDVRCEITLSAEDGAWLEFLPQETILFDGARLRRQTTLHAHANSTILAGEMLIFGRTARGERFTYGLAREDWRVIRDGRLLWADALHVDSPDLLTSAAGFAGAVACATALLVCPQPLLWRDAVRERLSSYGGKAGATVVNGLLVVRWLDDNAERLRASFAEVWAYLRHHTGHAVPTMPRLWAV